ncbi:MAG: hypothetical protein IJK53_11655 [Erysipelotrichaceae bacterium]|nr:hypothetical protein [Erysipelotrichaceae bacterium]
MRICNINTTIDMLSLFIDDILTLQVCPDELNMYRSSISLFVKNNVDS